MDTVHVKLKVVIDLLIICDIEVGSLSTSLYLSERQIRRGEYCGMPFSLSSTNSGTVIPETVPPGNRPPGHISLYR